MAECYEIMAKTKILHQKDVSVKMKLNYLLGI